MGLSEDSVGLSGSQWESVGLSGTQWESVGLSGTQWDSVGVSGAQWGSVDSVGLIGGFSYTPFKDGVVERRARSTRWEGGSGTIFSRDVYVRERRIDSVNHNVEGTRMQTVAMDTVFSSVTSRGTDSNKVGEYVRSSLIPKNI